MSVFCGSHVFGSNAAVAVVAHRVEGMLMTFLPVVQKQIVPDTRLANQSDDGLATPVTYISNGSSPYHTRQTTNRRYH